MRSMYVAPWPSFASRNSETKRAKGSSAHKPTKAQISAGVGPFRLTTLLITPSNAALQAPLKIPAITLNTTVLRECRTKKERMFIFVTSNLSGPDRLQNVLHQNGR